jgi:hypothetical protein
MEKKSKTLLCKEAGFKLETVRRRMKEEGLSFEEAFNKVKEKNKNKKKRERFFYGDKNLVEACREKGIKYVTAINRIRHGMTVKEAVETALMSNTKYYYKGERLIDYCKKNNINYNRVLDRLQAGIDMETAVITDMSVTVRGIKGVFDRRAKYIYNGKTLVEICKEMDIPYRTIQRRIQKGMSIEEALKEPIVYYNCSRRKKHYSTMK